jgi:hypothetical protein
MKMNLPVASYRVSEEKSLCYRDFLALPCSKLQGIIKFNAFTVVGYSYFCLMQEGPSEQPTHAISAKLISVRDSRRKHG